MEGFWFTARKSGISLIMTASLPWAHFAIAFGIHIDFAFSVLADYDSIPRDNRIRVPTKKFLRRQLVKVFRDFWAHFGMQIIVAISHDQHRGDSEPG